MKISISHMFPWLSGLAIIGSIFAWIGQSQGVSWLYYVGQALVVPFALLYGLVAVVFLPITLISALRERIKSVQDDSGHER